MANTKAIWVPPLPSGWEARFDPSKRAYFFINHQTKTTQWEDPRFPQAPVAPLAQAHPPTQNHASAAFQSLGQISEHKGNDGSVSLPLQDFNHGLHSKTFLRSGTEPLRSESTFSSDLNMAVANKLHTEFPKLPREIIVDILMLCHNSEREAREQLKDICSTDSNASSSHHTPQRTATGNGSGNASMASPKRLATADSSPKKQPARNSSPHNQQYKKKHGGKSHPPPAVKAEISEAEKTRVFNMVKSGFPNSDADVINIALNHCNYNLEETTELVKAWEKKKGEEEQKLKSARAQVANGGNSSSSPTHVFVPPTTSLEPAGMDDAAANKPQGLVQPHPNPHRPGPRPGGKGVAAESSVPHSEPQSSKAKGSNGSSVLSLGASDANSVLGPSHHHESAQHVTRMSEHLLNTTNDLLNHLATTATCCAAEDEEVLPEVDDASRNKTIAAAATTSTVDHSGKVVIHPKVVVNQPTAAATHGEKQAFVSPLRSTNKGHNAELCRGPNSSLLTSDYTHANGPNISLRCGPDKTRMSGPMKAQGPNTTLPCGPQSSLLQKNQSNASTLIHAASTYVSSHV